MQAHINKKKERKKKGTNHGKSSKMGLVLVLNTAIIAGRSAAWGSPETTEKMERERRVIKTLTIKTKKKKNTDIILIGFIEVNRRNLWEALRVSLLSGPSIKTGSLHQHWHTNEIKVSVWSVTFRYKVKQQWRLPAAGLSSSLLMM